MQREHLIKSYIKNMTTYLSKTTNKSPSEIETFVKKVTESKFDNVQVTNIISDSNQDTSKKQQPLWDFIHNNHSNVITPGGSIYKPATQQVALVKEMIIDRLAERSVVKKKMLNAKAAGDHKVAKISHYQQATIKIGINSLPGGMGSPYNCFYDRGGYNAITSTARALIGQSFAVCEQLLGGNFAWFETEDVINHIITNINHRASDNTIDGIMTRYKLKQITPKELSKYFIDSVKLYKPKLNPTAIIELTNTLTPQEVNYLYYMGNLRHIIWHNKEVFRPWIDNLMDVTNLDYTQEVDPQDLYKIDGDLRDVLTATYNQLTEGLQFKDLPKKRVDLASKFVIIANHFNKNLDAVKDLFDNFVHFPTNTPRINNKKHMWRSTVIASDTDSVLFTSKDWMEWMTGDVLQDSVENQQISSLVVYWLTKATAHVLKKFSIQVGATGDDIYRMKMKNEFKYSSFILFELKKTYAGVVTIQEGVVLPEPDADIKGANLRSSSIPEHTTKFIKNTIIDDILKASINKKLSATKLIKRVVTFEEEIRQSVLSGSVEFLKMTSVNIESSYANPLSTAYFYYIAWNHIFGKKYSDIRIPTKVSILPLQKPNVQYKKYLQNTDKNIYKNFTTFVDQYKKFPPKIAIADTIPKIPKELLPIIDTRDIIYNNVKPLYLTLSGLGIDVGYEKQKVLLSDIYPLNN